MSDAKWLLDQQSRLESDRSNYDSWWQDIAYRVLPAQATFTTLTTGGEKRTERLFAGKPVIANERFAAVMDDLLTPRSQVWHMLASDDEDMAEDQEVKEYFEAVNKILFAQRYRPRANFASQNGQGYLSLGAFGNSCLFIDENVGEGPRYKSLFMRDVFWTENHDGMVDVVNRKMCLTGRNMLACAKKYGWNLPAKLAEAGEKEPLREFEFLHCVRPNEDRMPGRADAKGMPFASYYISMSEKQMVGTGGYTSFPFAIGRHMLAPREVYARSPAMACWPAIMTLNEEKKTVLRAGQRQVDPPLLLTDDGALEAFNMRSGALNPGRLSDTGEPLVKVLETGADIPLGVELMQLEGQDIDDSFLVSLFRVMTENPQMTATQVLEIVQQKAVLLAPVMGRQHSEYLGPMIARELDILSKMGALPEMPDALLERGGEYKIEYRSPLARAQRAQDGVAIMRTFEALPLAIQVDPNAALIMDAPGAMREVAEINGVPAKLIRNKEAVEAILQQQAAQEQAAQAAAMAPELSTAALNAAKAQQIRAQT